LQYESTYLKPAISHNGNNNHPPDELDAIALLQKTIAFANRFKIILIPFFVTGLAIGLYFYFTSPPQYSTRLIVHSKLLSNQEEIEIIDNWEKLLADEKTQLARIMNCRKEVVEKLIKLSAEEILKVYASDNPNGFIINVSVSDVSILDELQRGIVYGLNNSPYVKEKIEVKKAKDNDLIKKTAEEISKLNTTKTTIDNLIQSGSATPMMLDISGINAEWVDLNEKLLAYQEDLKFAAGVQVLANFNKGKLIRSGLLKFSFLGIATGLFIGYLLSLLLYVRIKMKAVTLTP
jgi:hypothetical protein